MSMFVHGSVYAYISWGCWMYVCVDNQWVSHEESEEGCGVATLLQRSPALGQQAEGRGQISATAAHVYTL